MNDLCCYLSGFISGFTINYFFKKCNNKKIDRIHTIDEEIIIDQPMVQNHLDNIQQLYPQTAQPCRRNILLPIADATVTT